MVGRGRTPSRLTTDRSDSSAVASPDKTNKEKSSRGRIGCIDITNAFQPGIKLCDFVSKLDRVGDPALSADPAVDIDSF